MIFEKSDELEVIFYDGENNKEVIDFFKGAINGGQIKLLDGKLKYINPYFQIAPPPNFNQITIIPKNSYLYFSWVGDEINVKIVNESEFNNWLVELPSPTK